MTYVCPTEKHKERFKDHEVSKLPGNWWRFSKPGTCIDMLCFQFFQGYWVVVGDLGDAIYHWNQKVDPQWIAGCNLDYVLGKCQASEVGRTFEEWDDSDCEADLDRWWKEHLDDLDEEDRLPETRKKLEYIDDAKSAIYEGKHFWEHWLYEEGQNLFGDDWWDFAGKFGVRPHIRGVLHLAALKVMVEKVYGKQGES